jgi:hypothetical protein
MYAMLSFHAEFNCVFVSFGTVENSVANGFCWCISPPVIPFMSRVEWPHEYVAA